MITISVLWIFFAVANSAHYAMCLSEPGLLQKILSGEVTLSARLASFTKLVVEYLNILLGDSRLFEFNRRRAWQIVRRIIGKWCHYFRSEESWYGKIYDVFGLKEFVKVVSIEPW